MGSSISVESLRRTSREVNGGSSLESALRDAVRGEVRFDGGSRALYATTGGNYRFVPIGVVVPLDIRDIERATAVCRTFGAPLLARGAGTSLAGQTVNTAVVLDTSKHLREILAIDPASRTARVQPGLVLDDLRHAAETHGLTFAPDPSTHAYCTLGGMIGNNSCGVHSVMGGKTVDNVEEMDVLLYDGTRLRVGPTSEAELDRIVREGGRRGAIYAGLRALRDRYADDIRTRYPRIPRRVSGYNLDELLPERGFNVARALVGSEGTCALVLEATVRLVHSPRSRVLLVLAYPDIYQAADDVPRVLEAGPIGLEGMDDRLVHDLREAGLLASERPPLPEGGGWLLAEFGGKTRDEAAGRAAALMRVLGNGRDAASMRLVEDGDEQHELWVLRESGLGATAHVPGQPLTWEGWEDAAVPPDRLGKYLREFRALLDRYGYACDLYGHFGDGCVHTRIDFDLTSAEGVRTYRRFAEDAANLVVRYGGSLSGEHGDGQSRAELLPRMFGPTIVQAFREFKTIWDPDWKMNPGKVVDPYPLDSHLRLGAGFAPPPRDTHFAFTRDRDDFTRATLRCVGVGACRKTEGGTMCPSYRVTLEEKHSTRGRARLLFEMLVGEPIARGWRSEEVKDALDLCLACKACRSECPVQVDMATYKAEFLSHYYDGRLRPLHAYAFGLIFRWARLAALAPRLANWFTNARLPAAIAKRVLGVPASRRLPAFAAETFRARFARRRRTDTAGRRVILWTDTFNNYFHPDTAVAAVDVLEACGFRVELPPPGLCCGRPLYDFGMLTTAKRQLTAIVAALRPAIRDGVPIVGLEPSCVSVLRHELTELFPLDEDARRLSGQVLLLGELLERNAQNVAMPHVDASAVVHVHCHEKAVLSATAGAAALRRLGIDAKTLDSGCCGMAGAFGFEADHYDVSIACGERVLLPAVRATPPETWIVADGFSCREQIAQVTGRRAWHVAEVLRHTWLAGHATPPDESVQPVPPAPSRRQTAAALLPLGLLLAGAAMVWFAGPRHHAVRRSQTT